MFHALILIPNERREDEPFAVSGALHENLLPLAMPRRYTSILLPALLKRIDKNNR